MNADIIFAGLAGCVAGALFFGSLGWSVERLLVGRLLSGLGLQLLRFLALAAALTMAARAGAAPLAAMTLGLTAARFAWSARLRRRP